MSYALASKKRKFHRALDSLSNTNAAQKPPAAPPQIKNNKPASSESQFSPTIKRVRRFQDSTTTSDDTAVRLSNRSIHRHSGASTTSLKPNFVPWDRERFLERLETFRKVDRWKPQPDDINEVQWAKRGWSCTDVMRVECVGGCGHSVVVKLPDDLEDLEEYDSEKIADRKEVRTQLVGKYRNLIIEGHGERCPWRKTGCDESIQRLALTKTEAALSSLRSRYSNLISLEDKLPSMENLILPEKLDLDTVSKILPHETLNEGVSANEKASTADKTSENTGDKATEFPSELLSDNQMNKVAFALALFGWDLSGDVGAGLADCKACFRRLGLWMYKPKDDGSSSLYSGLDVASEHLDYCPWINAKSQSGTGKGHCGWEALEQVIRSQHRRKTWYEPSASQSDEAASTEPSVNNVDEETRKAKDKEWWSKLRRVRQALQVRTPKKGKSTG